MQERVESLEESRRQHEVRLNLLASIAERQQTLLEEVRRDVQHNQRMWVRVAQRYGWLDDEDFPQAT